MNSGILLGIFTGNHAGAEALFEAGEYAIGSAAQCDVALTDSTLASRHCSFSLATDGTVRLSPLEGTVTLDGKSLSAPLDWPARSPALAGLVCLAWTIPGQGWADMKLPSLLAAEASPAETPLGGAQAEAADKTHAHQETAGHNPAWPAGMRSGRILWLAVSGMVILCLIGLTIDFSSSRDKSANWVKTLEHILTSAGFPDVLVGENAGRRMISGLVPTEADANTVRGIAAGQSYPIQVTVRTQEEFCNAIRSALAGHGFFPQVRIESGEAVLLGYALDRLTENAALSWARNAAPRVAPIRSALLTRGAVEETLAAELDKAGLRGKIAVDWRPGVIALSGETADKNALNRIMEAVRGVLNSPIAFQLVIASEQERIYVGNAGQDVPPAQNHAPESQGNPFGGGLSLRSVSPVQHGGAGLPFISTSDGAVYFLGGTLPSGHTLTGVYADRLEFSRNGTNMAYKLQGR
jgi:type III secretion system YscD/HrpQ family protein